MGLSKSSTGAGAAGIGDVIRKRRDSDRLIALAGNPNVGKSTVFNALTGLHQHTGNWPGKTVTNARGECTYHGRTYVLADLPGCYSLLAHSAEEEAARDLLCAGRPDAAVVVCDATCLERNMNLVLQTLEIIPRTVVCVNLMDEAKRKGISVDLKRLSHLLGVPVVGTSARGGKGLEPLLQQIELVSGEDYCAPPWPPVLYSRFTEQAVERLVPALRPLCGKDLSPRWLALRLLEDGDGSLEETLKDAFGISPREDPRVSELLKQIGREAQEQGISREELRDGVVTSLVNRGAELAGKAVTTDAGGYSLRDRTLDRILTGRATGFPIMALMLLGIFWLTMTGANIPSAFLSGVFARVGRWLEELLAGTPDWFRGLFLDGMYKTLSWVVSVMLPPMAIFFPLFTLLEDLGYLPRVAFNLDRCFHSCGACGKQALTVCMGFGCNAAGVVGCRIIDSPRERLIAILTNNFVPCNGRLPMLISLIAMFFAGFAGEAVRTGFVSSALSALLLMAVILLGLGLTFLTAKLLSETVLKGETSSFTLELPPYRKPQIGRVIVRSVFDRTLFVLGRAAAVAAPAGLLIWILANMQVNGVTLLAHCSGALDPAGRLFGMDGVILLAFLLGLPANEIVIPIIVMAYMAQGSLVDMTDLTALHALLVGNGWTWVTALCTMLFSLLHWPCSTTCITVWKETRSLKWTAAAFLLPTSWGLLLCFLVSACASLFGA